MNCARAPPATLLPDLRLGASPKHPFLWQSGPFGFYTPDKSRPNRRSITQITTQSSRQRLQHTESREHSAPRAIACQFIERRSLEHHESLNKEARVAQLPPAAVTLSDRRDSRSSSLGPVPRKRRSVEEEIGIPEPPDIVAETNLVCFTAEVDAELLHSPDDQDGSPSRARSPPPQYPASEASGITAFRPPPSFSSLFPTQVHEPVFDSDKPPIRTDDDVTTAATASASTAAPAYAPCCSSSEQVTFPGASSASSAALRFQDETKRALPQDPEKGRSSSKDDEAEPPPAYEEGSSPLHSFTYLMAAAGGASSIITQVQQGGPALNPLGGW